MKPAERRALLLVIEALRTRWEAENPAAGWVATNLANAVAKLDEAAELLKA